MKKIVAKTFQKLTNPITLVDTYHMRTILIYDSIGRHGKWFKKNFGSYGVSYSNNMFLRQDTDASLASAFLT